MDISKLKIFTDYVCPWCYLSHARLKKIIMNYNLHIQIIHFPLHPETPGEGKSLLDLFQCTPMELEQKNIAMQKLIKKENINYSFREFTYNSRLAQELGLWAEKKYKNEDIHDRIYDAYFNLKLNINEKDVLLKIVSCLALPMSEAKDVLFKRLYKDEIDEHWKISYKEGVTSVPMYKLNKNYLVGAQNIKDFENFFKIENVSFK